jgi:hypothetical protein
LNPEVPKFALLNLAQAFALVFIPKCGHLGLTAFSCAVRSVETIHWNVRAVESCSAIQGLADTFTGDWVKVLTFVTNSWNALA